MLGCIMSPCIKKRREEVLTDGAAPAYPGLPGVRQLVQPSSLTSRSLIPHQEAFFSAADGIITKMLSSSKYRGWVFVGVPSPNWYIYLAALHPRLREHHRRGGVKVVTSRRPRLQLNISSSRWDKDAVTTKSNNLPKQDLHNNDTSQCANMDGENLTKPYL